MINPDIPHIPPSAEVRHAAMIDDVIGHDWAARFLALGARMRTLRTMLDGVVDPAAMIPLIELRGAALRESLGAGALTCFSASVTADRARFEAEFGGGASSY